MAQRRKRPVYIYGLTWPGKKQVMYVGQTTSLKRRIPAHMTQRNCNRRKLAWLDSLIEYGYFQPEYKILEECSRRDADNREWYWINYYGPLLLNHNYDK